MRKISVPINLNAITDENLPLYLESVKKNKVHRVFLIGFDPIYHKSSILHTQTEKVAFVVSEFKKVVSEVGFWISSLGHGGSLNFMDPNDRLEPDTYTPIEGVGGEIAQHGYCPTDERLRKDLGDCIRDLAKLKPDIIMLDDDYRMHCRSYYMGCFCPAHRKEYFRRIGEDVPRDKLEKLIWSGGANKYRTEYMKLMGETLMDFAKELRSRIDEVDPTIRFGSCTCLEAWDVNGIDVADLQSAFCGKNRPFTRVCGAPYWNPNIIHQLETTRLEFSWIRDIDIEVMSEGDTYPRPRYNCPSKPLELFDLLLIANNQDDDLLNYIYEYNFGPEYESGYEERYLKNEGLRCEVAEIFKGKKSVGVEVFQNIHILENYDFPEEAPKNVHKAALEYYQARSSHILSQNSIATCFENKESGYPLLLVGENAKYVDLSRLKNGAMLDRKAAKILSARGVDVGFAGEKCCTADSEYFIAQNDRVRVLGGFGNHSLTHSDSAEVLSIFKPDNTTASYRYENAQGQRFLVLGYDAYIHNLNKNYFNNYYRQEQIAKNVEWLCGKKLPAMVFKNPNLYILASKDENSMAVALANVFIDDVLEPIIQLDRKYSEIRFVNCSGRLDGDKVYLSDITPYGFAAFEVK